MSKKLISVVLALVLVLSSFAVSAFAGIGDYAYEEVNEETGEIPYNQTWTLGTPDDTDGDGEWTVDVSLETDYRVGAIQFVIANADKNAVLADVVINTGVFGNKATVEFSPDGKVLIVPKPTSAADKGPELTDGPVIATLYYTLKSGASSAKIAIDNNPKNEEFVDGTLIAVRMSDDSLVNGTAIYGQNVLSTGEEQTIGSAAAEPPTLAVKAGTIGVINTERTVVDSYNDVECTGYIYGVEPGKALNTVFEVVGDGTMEVVASGSKECATGTTVNVLDLEGNVVETYMFILFGDVTGDGVINTIDAGDIELHDAGMWGYNLETEENVYEDLGYDGNFPEYKIFAGNVDGNTATNTIDAGNIALHDAGMWGYNLETEENIYEDLGLDGCFTQEYIISKLN